MRVHAVVDNFRLGGKSWRLRRKCAAQVFAANGDGLQMRREFI